jgi:hypothetical protein
MSDKPKIKITLELTEWQLGLLQDAIFEAMDSDNFDGDSNYVEKMFGEMYNTVSKALKEASK